MDDQTIDVPLTNEDQQAEKKRVDFEQIIFKNKWTIGFLLFGILLLGVGILSVKSFPLIKDETKIEVLKDGLAGGPEVEGVSIDVGNEIVLEIAGEVQKPGVYRLTEGDRVGDLLTEAGGLSANADREWVAKNINQAQKLVDGVKVYIPNKTQVPSTKTQTNSNDQNSNIESKININTATIPELDRLWGIGEATAKKIVENRPYQEVEDLLRKKVVNASVWTAIKDKISVW